MGPTAPLHAERGGNTNLLTREGDETPRCLLVSLVVKGSTTHCNPIHSTTILLIGPACFLCDLTEGPPAKCLPRSCRSPGPGAVRWSLSSDRLSNTSRKNSSNESGDDQGLAETTGGCSVRATCAAGSWSAPEAIQESCDHYCEVWDPLGCLM